MDYKKHYENLIKTRTNRKIDESTIYENHHIIPKSMGGTNNNDNLIFLTLREHFVAHWLLWRIHNNKEMAFAFRMMCFKYKNCSSRIYAESKMAQYKYLKGKSPMQGRKMSIEHKLKIKNARNETFEYRKKTIGSCYKLSKITKDKISESSSGKNNAMYGTSFYKKWVDKFGENVAKKMKTDVYKNRISKGRSKTIKFTSPLDEIYIITGKMKEFCANNNLCYSIISNILNNSRENNYKGWKVTEINI